MVSRTQAQDSKSSTLETGWEGLDSALLLPQCHSVAAADTEEVDRLLLVVGSNA